MYDTVYYNSIWFRKKNHGAENSVFDFLRCMFFYMYVCGCLCLIFKQSRLA